MAALNDRNKVSGIPIELLETVCMVHKTMDTVVQRAALDPETASANIQYQLTALAVSKQVRWEALQTGCGENVRDVMRISLGARSDMFGPDNKQPT